MTAERAVANHPRGIATLVIVMLSQLVPVLTLAATLLHSVLGCCWHHGHDVKAPSRPEQVSQHSQACAHHHHGHHHDRSVACENESSDDPCEHQDGQCHEPSCVYVVGKYFEMPPAPMLDAWLTVEMTEGHPTLTVASAHSSVVMPPPMRSAPELRALLQVWVI